jgi:2-C-methyl-D-erythritol 4-phosphate cytidylyltransferase
LRPHGVALAFALSVREWNNEDEKMMVHDAARALTEGHQIDFLVQDNAMISKY